MEQLLDEVCAYVHNYFPTKKPNGIHTGIFNISSGTIECDFLVEGQYFRVKGSIFNDGVHRYPATDLQDEEFIGEIWAMAVPQNLLSLIEEIEAWNAKYGGIDSVNYSPFTSESFNNYSYSKGSRSNGSGSSSGTPVTWKDAFASRLARWRKISDVI